MNIIWCVDTHNSAVDGGGWFVDGVMLELMEIVSLICYIGPGVCWLNFLVMVSFRGMVVVCGGVCSNGAIL